MPRLSIVATSRNDNHGGSLTRRMQVFVKGLIAQARRHSWDAELVLVEWNPPKDRVGLAEELDWGGAGPLAVRLVQVPEALHGRFEHADKLPLFQMIAKNVGIRRARGDFVLATNIDLLFNDPLCEFLGGGAMSEGELLRIDRHDVRAEVPEDADIAAQLAWCEANLIRVNAREGTFPLDADGARAVWDKDVVAPGDGLRFGEGWFGPEVNSISGEPHRYAEPACELLIRGAGAARRLILELSPGPGVGDGPFDLIATIEGRLPPQRLRVEGRGEVAIPVPAFEGVEPLRLRVAQGGKQRGHHTRVLAFSLHRGCWADATGAAPSQPRSLRARFGELARRLFGAGRGVPEGEPALYPPLLHTNACGDFTLMHRDDWLRIGGYPELAMYSMHIDSLGVYEAFHAGLRERILRDPMRCYHIEHGAGWTPDGESTLFASLDARGIPYLTYQAYLDQVAAMHRRAEPLLFNREAPDWGLNADELDEHEPRASSVDSAASGT